MCAVARYSSHRGCAVAVEGQGGEEGAVKALKEGTKCGVLLKV